MKQYDITIAFLTESGEPACFTIPGYYAESAWRAVASVLYKRSVSCITDDRLIRIDVSRSKKAE